MKIIIYQVDSFSGELFKGNPAAICPLRIWLPVETMQKIAMENNLSETGFYVHEPNGYRIRWFTPAAEVELCGHATLAAGHVLFNHEGYAGDDILFNSLSGILKVRKNGDMLVLDFPADTIQPAEASKEILQGLNCKPVQVFKGRSDLMLVLTTEMEIAELNPDFTLLSRAAGRGIIVTAPGDSVDFVSRFFAPAVGINEDPVTGSAHTTLTPYWAKRLNKTELTAMQLSKRTGILYCRLNGDRVEIAGQAVTYLTGAIDI
jgi:PhzF family phenazine biosynthesis protein